MFQVPGSFLHSCLSVELEVDPKTSHIDQAITLGSATQALTEQAAREVRQAILSAAEAIGLDLSAIERRLEQPAANAWQEREWVKADLKAVSVARQLDLEDTAGRAQAADFLDRFYAEAAMALDRALGIEPVGKASHRQESDRLVRTRETLAVVHRQHGWVAFEREDHAERFARDLKERYGERVMTQIASGDTSALALNFPESRQQREIAKAPVAAAESHESIGLSRRQAELARERLHAREQQHEKPEHALRRKDHDLDL